LVGPNKITEYATLSIGKNYWLIRFNNMKNVVALYDFYYYATYTSKLITILYCPSTNRIIYISIASNFLVELVSLNGDITIGLCHEDFPYNTPLGSSYKSIGYNLKDGL